MNCSGEITLQTEQLLQRLQRSLPPAPEAPTHLCALNFDVNVLNARKLCEMEGKSLSKGIRNGPFDFGGGGGAVSKIDPALRLTEKKIF